MRATAFIVAACAAFAAAAQDSPPAFAAFDRAGPPELADPHDLAFGPDGRLYVADKFNGRIAVLDPETLEVVAAIGDGRLAGVRDVSFAPDGRALVAASALSAIVIFDDLTAETPQPTLVLPAPRSEGALLHSNGRVYAMASGTGMLMMYEGETLAGAYPGFFAAHDVAEAPGGDIWVADTGRGRLVRLSPDLIERQVIDHPRFGMIGPRYLAFDDFGRMAVADQDAHRILLIDPDAPGGGALVGVLGTGAPGLGPNLFDDPEGVAYHDGAWYVSDSDNNRVVRYVIVTN